MRSLRPLDWLLLAILVPLFAVCFGLHVRQVGRGGLLLTGVTVRAQPGHYPEVLKDWSGVHGPGALRAGDRLVRAGDTDLFGIRGSTRLWATVIDSASGRRRLPMTIERGGRRADIDFAFARYSARGSRILLLLSLAIVGVIILLRAPPGVGARLAFASLLCFAIFESVFPGGSGAQYALASASFALMGPVALTVGGWWLIHFPSEVEPQWRLSNGWAFAFAPIWAYDRWLAELGFPGLPDALAVPPAGLQDGLIAAGYVTILTWNYLHADPIGRRRVKWVLTGGYIGALPTLVLGLAGLSDPLPGWYPSLHALSIVAPVAIPLALLLAILRFNLFDIDKLITRTASYTLMAVLLLAGLFGLLPTLSHAASHAVGLDATSTQLILSLGFAAVLIPLNQRVRPWVEGILFSGQRTVEQGVEQLILDLGECDGPNAVIALAGERIDALLDPETCSIYGAGEPDYVRIYARGPSPAPSFEHDGLLAQALRSRSRQPLVLDDTRRPGAERPLSPFDRAALETLQAAVVLPIRRGDRLRGFLCLGPKQSLDVYTPTDLTLLLAVVDKVASELLRFDDAEVIRQERAMADSLRRYVPGAVAERLESGREIESSEREVSVLFVDLRAYTSLAEERRPGEIFSTVNRYTEAVSRIVKRHGGSVVDFQGDGMMSVFGAPNELPAKEDAALAAAREIVGTVGTLPFDGGPDGLSVGVGIATGEAFVGNLRAVDRMVWSALGNTTNLAARLQSMTRELEAAIVIDATTHERARDIGDLRAGGATRIRGRSRREEIFYLPLAT